MWECEWKELKTTRLEIADYVNTLELEEALNPRDAFFGGRTNAATMYYKVKPDEQIHYIDFTSLYPWVNKKKIYPKGHPTFLSHPGHTDISDYFGIVKCKIEPPRELYHPVLPHKQNDKLTFPLCGKCVDDEMAKSRWHRSSQCSHFPGERALLGTWCTPELEKALDMGYRIVYIYEVWHFPERMEGLFEDYVNTWLKLKQEASGWPARVGEDETKRQQYIQDYYEHERIWLDYEKIEYNPGLRSLAKMMLNSMWGKFGQRLNKTQVKQFVDPVNFHTFLDSEKHDISLVDVVNESMVEVQYKHQDESIPQAVNLNIFVAAFTTCWARLRLYETLELLGDRVLYYDTDSIIYVKREGEIDPELGDYLGEFTNELNQGDHIVEFVSGGPKNYGYRTQAGKVECKVRGFRLNCEGKKQLNYEVMRNNVLDEIQLPLKDPRQTQVINTSHIVRDAKNFDLYTFPQYKHYQLVYDKRVIDPKDFKTYPYGYHPSS